MHAKFFFLVLCSLLLFRPYIYRHIQINLFIYLYIVSINIYYQTASKWLLSGGKTHIEYIKRRDARCW